jgi:hypothetical protein
MEEACEINKPRGVNPEYGTGTPGGWRIARKKGLLESFSVLLSCTTNTLATLVEVGPRR